ncbi:MAG: phage baseplate assembly protein V [Lachnospiraceae bacterium]
MDTITFENIKVDGIPFSRIRNLTIQHSVNAHGICHIEGEINQQAAEEIIQRVDESFALQLTTGVEGQPSRLFYGAVSKIRMEKENSYAVIILDGITSSGRIDSKRASSTFQNTSQTYGQLLNGMLSGRGSVQVMTSDKPVGTFIMKCDETDWEFVVRMASRLGAPACINIISQKPQIYIGIPPVSKEIAVDTVSFGVEKDVLLNGSAAQTIKSYEYAYLGDAVRLNGKSYRVKSVKAELVDGLLECSYGCSTQSGFIMPKMENTQASGRMMRGIVQKVEADRVQVFFNSMDSSYDNGGDWWFPYSTAYSSQDGSGWYSMPSEGDEVRVFFPSGNEGEAFAAGAVAKHVRADVKDKAWSGVNGKEILMTKDGLIITCKNQKIYIKLSDESGIEIISDQNINVTSGTNVNIAAGDTIKIIAENEVVIGTAESHLNMRKEGISATGNNIIVV